MDENSVAKILNKIFNGYGILVVVLGTIGNIFGAIICLQKRLRKIPTFVFLAFLQLIDVTTIYLWNINEFAATFFGYRPFDSPEILLKVTSWIQLSSYEASSWLLIAMVIDRYLSVAWRTWRIKLFNTRKAVISSFVIIVSLYCLNIPYLTATIPTAPPNSTIPISYIYIAVPIVQIFNHIQLYAYTIIPIPLLVICNSLLVKQTLCGSGITERSEKDKKKRRAISISVALVTILFIVLNLPISILGGFFILKTTSPLGRAFENLAGKLGYTYHAIHFIVLISSNYLFRAEFLSLMVKLRCMKRSKYSE